MLNSPDGPQQHIMTDITVILGYYSRKATPGQQLFLDLAQKARKKQQIVGANAHIGPLYKIQSYRADEGIRPYEV